MSLPRESIQTQLEVVHRRYSVAVSYSRGSHKANNNDPFYPEQLK